MVPELGSEKKSDREKKIERRTLDLNPFGSEQRRGSLTLTLTGLKKGGKEKVSALR